MTRIQPYGDSHLLITPTIPAHQAASALRIAYPHVDVRAGMNTVLFADPTVPDTDLTTILDTYIPTEDPFTRDHVIPVEYCGDDLATAAASTGITVEELIHRHTATTWIVAMLGFAPGFPYLVPDSAEDTQFWSQIPRLAAPRTRVPAGSVAVAAGMSSIYPSDSPGGWHLLGTTTVTLFDPAATSPSLLAPGDRVRFTPTKETA